MVITAVTGCARSGTSLMMRMLEAGGIEPLCNRRTAYETDLIFDTSYQWLDQAEGKSVKLLDLQRHLPIPHREWRFILLHRDPVEQVRSTMKFVTLMYGLPADETDLSQSARDIERDVRTIRDHISKRGPALDVHFERLLADPEKEAARVARFCDLDCSPDSLAEVVIPRDPKCWPSLMEFDLMKADELSETYGVPFRLAFERLREVAS